MKNSIKYALLLFCVGSICASLVIVSSNFANPILEEREETLAAEALNSLYDNIETYEDISDSTSVIKYDLIDNLYLVTREEGIISYVYKISSPGKNGNIVYLLALDEEGKVIKINYISQNETPGRGDRITLENFTSQFENDSYNDFTVDTISGATLSSQSMINSTTMALEHFNKEVK